MAVTAVLHPDPQKFPAGTTVKAYKRSNWANQVVAPSGAPEGAQDASATVAADGSVTFTGLVAETNYLIYAATPDRYATFSTRTSSSGSKVYSGTQDFSGATVTLPSGLVVPAGSVDATAIAASLKPSGSAVDATEALRALGPAAGKAAAGLHAAQHQKAGADPLALSQYDRDLSTSVGGLLAPMPLYGGTTNQLLTASTLYVARFVPSRAMTAALIAFVVATAATTNDNVDVGLYDSSGNRLVASGATASKVNSTGVKTIAFAGTALTAGTVYYAAFAYGTTAGTVATLVAHLTSTSGAQFFGASMPNIVQGNYAAAATLPASISVSPTGAVVPLLAVRES